MRASETWTNEEDLVLKANYPTQGKAWCMNRLNRTEGSVRDRASKLGLKLDKTSQFYRGVQNRAAASKLGKKRPEQAKVMKRLHAEGKLLQTAKQRAQSGRKWSTALRTGTYPHPRGMLGKNHSVSTKKKFSDQRRGRKLNLTPIQRQQLSDRASRSMALRFARHGTVYSRSTAGWFQIGDQQHFFRSTWEVNYARYLEFLKRKKDIIDWEFEVDTFWFDGIKRGVRSYLPDFKVTETSGVSYHEVKGWLDPKSKTKLARMKKYHPKIKMVLIAKDEYKEVIKWERMYPEALAIKKPGRL